MADETVSKALAHREVQALPATISVPSDDEIRRMYRLAEALAQSGVYKDATQAGQAFAKILVGRDLGLSPARAMAGLHFVKGQVQVHYRTLGAFVRANGYQYKIVELTPERVSIEFYDRRDADGTRELLGVSTFTQDDAKLAGLTEPTRSGEPSNYLKYPRNMLIARAMSNGVGWFLPDALGGIPVYVNDEIPQRAELTAGEGSGEAQGLDLGPKVEEIMARARKLGHAGIGDRATVEMSIGRRSPQVVKDWVSWATRELDDMDPEVDTGQEADIPDAEVVPDESSSGFASSSEAPVVAGEDIPAGSEVRLGDDGQMVVTKETLGPEQVDSFLPDSDVMDPLNRRLSDLLDAEDADLTEQQQADRDAEIDHVRAEIEAREDPGQGSLGV